jgi:hypothetical protein
MDPILSCENQANENGLVTFRNENYEEGTITVLGYYQNAIADHEESVSNQDMFNDKDVDFMV